MGRPRTCYILHGLCSPIAGWMAGLGGAGLLLLRPFWKPGPCWRLCFFRDKETEVQKIGDLRPLRLENDRTVLCSKAKFACYSRCFLTSYFCIPVP